MEVTFTTKIIGHISDHELANVLFDRASKIEQNLTRQGEFFTDLEGNTYRHYYYSYEPVELVSSNPDVAALIDAHNALNPIKKAFEKYKYSKEEIEQLKKTLFVAQD
ncbi:hypothetical protein [Spartinivicinus poritis]|uniref:Uncharacterized protein n=1 Tax=Spartinivicinus poritis TaxID=2994640 RepID=A0ABT5UH44_9GAMM|nr:hypothetical protein [Spartinivicinus sp. A2-2]MDE1464817.1 hypothetical protein [Spartinivicinus sp. A2-2]